MFPTPAISDRGEETFREKQSALLSSTAPQEEVPPLVPGSSSAAGAPAYQYGTTTPFLSDDDNESARLCRICLESDHPQDLIAPCRCKGTSRWVHRECLDLWRTHEQDRAFGACTECHFRYRYTQQPQDGGLWSRQTKFCLFVSRDLCLVTVAVQAVIALWGGLLYLVLHAEDDWSDWICDKHSNSTNEQSSMQDEDNDVSFGCRHELLTYYLLGLFGMLVSMGIFGSIFLCRNGCQLPSDHHRDVDRRMTTTAEAPVSHQQERSQFYSSQRRRGGGRGREDSCDSCCRNCVCIDPLPGCDCCCYYPYPRYGYYGGHYYPYGGGYNSSSSEECCCCCPAHHSGGGGGGNNDCGDATHIVLMLLLFFAVILAIIGLTVGIIVGVVITQRIIQRHVFLLQKKRLVEEFQVADLSKTTGYDAGDELTDLEEQRSSATPEYGGPVKPTAPPDWELNAENETHLRTLGLLE